MAENNEPTPEQIVEKKEKARTVALANLKGSISDLATAYLVKKGLPYGKEGNRAVYDFIYKSAKATEEGQEFINNLFEASREDEDDTYSGNISDNRVIKTAAAILQSSIKSVKVGDLYELMGSEIEVREEYKGKYLEDVAKSGDEGKKFVGTLTAGFQTYLVQSRVEKAVGESKKATVKNLEELVKEPEKKSE